MKQTKLQGIPTKNLNSLDQILKIIVIVWNIIKLSPPKKKNKHMQTHIKHHQNNKKTPTITLQQVVFGDNRSPKITSWSLTTSWRLRSKPAISSSLQASRRVKSERLGPGAVSSPPRRSSPATRRFSRRATVEGRPAVARAAGGFRRPNNQKNNNILPPTKARSFRYENWFKKLLSDVFWLVYM